MMKTILIFIFITLTLFGFTQPPPNGSYVINNDINKFVGTWKYKNGNDIFIIKLIKVKFDFKDYFEDILIGSHEYIKNGVQVESSLDNFNLLPTNHKQRNVFLHKVDATYSPDCVVGLIKEITKNKFLTLQLTYISKATPELIWKSDLPEGVYTDPNFQLGHTLPKNLVLIKQL